MKSYILYAIMISFKLTPITNNPSFKFNYEDGMDIYHNDKKILTSDTENTKKTTTTLLRTILVLTQVRLRI